MWRQASRLPGGWRLRGCHWPIRIEEASTAWVRRSIRFHRRHPRDLDGGDLNRCHTFRQSFTTHLLMAGHDIRTILELLGRRDVKTTMVYTHLIGKAGGRGVTSSADTLGTHA